MQAGCRIRTSTGIYIDSDFHGYSNYDAGNVKFEHRAGDLAVTAVFTWAKSMDDKSATAGAGATGTGYQGFENNSMTRTWTMAARTSTYPYRFVSSYIYNCRSDAERSSRAQSTARADLAIGGWQVTGITTFQKGFPYSVRRNDIQSMNGIRLLRANIIARLQHS